jgi:hypothetical protein
MRQGGPPVSPPLSYILSALMLLALATPTQAYVRSTTKESFTPLRWMDSNCVYMRINATGSADINDGSDVQAVKNAIEKNWPDLTRSCSYLKFLLMPETADAKPSFTKEGCNESVVYWVERACASKDDTDCWQHDKMAAAITTVFFVEKKGDPRDGRILDADMELNGVWFKWSSKGQIGRTDIENTVTHELGHVMGLDHPCWDLGANRPRDASGKLLPMDDQGQSIPTCTAIIGSKLPEHKEMREVTMYNYAEPGETKKRTPETDDIEGICAIYPKASDPGVCKQVCYGADDGCAVAAGDPDGPDGPPLLPILFMGLALVILGLSRRSRQARR